MVKNIIVLGYNLGEMYSYKINNERINLALNLYNIGDKLILSGGDVANVGITEAEYMYNLIPKEQLQFIKNIILDEESINTIDNISNCMEYISNSSIIITHEYHQPRTQYIQKRLAPEIDPIYMCVENKFPKRFIDDRLKNENKYMFEIDKYLLYFV